MTTEEAANYLRKNYPEWYEGLSTYTKGITEIAFAWGYTNGYNDGFQVGCAAERGIKAMQSKFDQLDALAEPEGGKS